MPWSAEVDRGIFLALEIGMVQNREPPAYQEYAASMMARREYRALSLSQRGLLYTLRMECWINKSIPSDVDILARMLGYDRDEIARALPYLMPFFTVSEGEILCPELESYRAYLEAVRAKKSAGGKMSAAKMHGSKKPMKLVK